MTVSDERGREMGTDEARSTGDENVHRKSFMANL